MASYGAGPVLRSAGLVHAAYGTDGFDTALLGWDERPALTAIVGPQVEALVYRFCATDRRPFYRQLGQPLVVWTDRVTGQSVTLDPDDLRPLVDLTVANELDVVEHSPEVRHEHATALHRLFTRARSTMSEAAWADVQRVLGGPA